MALAEIRDIEKAFAGRSVLKGISFDLQKGERIGLVGANGSGKSTLLKIIAVVEQADHGHVNIAKACKLAYVSQIPRLDPERYPIQDDQRFVLELLRSQHVLVVQGTGFNWAHPDHLRIVTLPHVDVLTDAIGRIGEFLSTCCSGPDPWPHEAAGSRSESWSAPGWWASR